MNKWTGEKKRWKQCEQKIPFIELNDFDCPICVCVCGRICGMSIVDWGWTLDSPANNCFSQFFFFFFIQNENLTKQCVFMVALHLFFLSFSFAYLVCNRNSIHWQSDWSCLVICIRFWLLLLFYMYVSCECRGHKSIFTIIFISYYYWFFFRALFALITNLVSETARDINILYY